MGNNQIIEVNIKGENETKQAPVKVLNHPHFYFHIETKEYKGEFGFDCMKSEYIKPEKKVLHSDMNERNGAICENIPQLEAIYNPVRFYENQPSYEQYYSPWIALFPNNTEYKLKLKKTILTGTFPKKTNIEFRCISPNIEINGLKINNTKTPVKLEVKDADHDVEFTIKCVGEISENNLAIELYAILPLDTFPDIKPFKVGQMYIQPNNVKRSQDILFVHAKFSKNCDKALNKKYDTKGKDSIQKFFDQHAFNQALYSCPILAYESFDINDLPGGEKFITDYALNNKIKKRDEKGNAEQISATSGTTLGAKTEYRDVTTNNIDKKKYKEFRDGLFQFLTQSPVWTKYIDRIDNHTLKLVVLIDVAVLTCENTPEARFKESGSYTTGEASFNGSYALIQCESLSKGFSFNSTIIHEIGHLLGLQHPWERTPKFRQGYTNSYMDYNNNGTNKTKYYLSPLIFMKTDWDSLKEGVAQLKSK